MTIHPAAPIPGLAQAVNAVSAEPAAIGLRTVLIGPDVLDQLPRIVTDLIDPAGGEVLLLTDGVDYRRGDEDLKAAVTRGLSTARSVRRVVLGGPERGHSDQARVHADEATVDRVVQAAHGAGLLVTIGSGTLADLGKVAAAHHRLPHVIVQTAASVNGYADDQSVLLRSGAKRTTPSRWPEAVIADIRVISQAPVSLNAAGVGDLLSMFTAPADWLLASTLGLGDRYVPELVDLVRPHGPRLLSLAHGVAAGDPADLEDLARLLTLSGLTMGLAGCTAPSSGTEHVISHLLEMRLTSRGAVPAWHGLQVGVSTLVASALWQRVRAHLADGRATFRLPDVDTARAQVHHAFHDLDASGRTATECWSAYERKLTWLAGHEDQVTDLLRQWSRLDAALDPLLISPRRLVAALDGSAIPVRFATLGPAYDEDTVLWAVTNGHRMRDRFTVADLADLLGIWTEQDAVALLDDLATYGAGA